MNKPAIGILLDVWREDYDGDDIVLVEDKVDGSWRHGTEHTAIFHRKSDDTHWCVGYRTTPGADYNDFREGDLDDSCVFKVKPVEKVVRTWQAA